MPFVVRWYKRTKATGATSSLLIHYLHSRCVIGMTQPPKIERISGMWCELTILQMLKFKRLKQYWYLLTTNCKFDLTKLGRCGGECAESGDRVWVREPQEGLHGKDAAETTWFVTYDLVFWFLFYKVKVIGGQGQTHKSSHVCLLLL